MSKVLQLLNEGRQLLRGRDAARGPALGQELNHL